MKNLTVTDYPIGEVNLTVTKDDLASSLGSSSDFFPDVFSTSKMVALMEIAASRVLKEDLLQNECSVGIYISVNHISATCIGSNVKAKALLIDIENKIYTFNIQAFDELGLIGEGIHKRFVVDTKRFEKGALRKISL